MHSRSIALAGLLVLGAASAVQAQTKTTPPPAPKPVPQVEGHSGAYCNLFQAQCRMEDSLRTLLKALQKNASVCTDAAACKAKNDSLVAKIDTLTKAQESQARADSIARADSLARAKAIANRRTPQRATGGPPPSAVTRGAVSPTQRISVAKGEAIIRVDTLWRTRYDTVTRVVERTILQIDTLVIVRQDTLKIHQVEFRNAKGFPIWRTLAGAAILSAGTCFIASQMMDNEPFRCFGGNDIEIRNRNRNENGALSIRRGVGLSISIGRP